MHVVATDFFMVYRRVSRSTSAVESVRGHNGSVIFNAKFKPYAVLVRS